MYCKTFGQLYDVDCYFFFFLSKRCFHCHFACFFPLCESRQALKSPSEMQTKDMITITMALTYWSESLCKVFFIMHLWSCLQSHPTLRLTLQVTPCFYSSEKKSYDWHKTSVTLLLLPLTIALKMPIKRWNQLRSDEDSPYGYLEHFYYNIVVELYA